MLFAVDFIIIVVAAAVAGGSGGGYGGVVVLERITRLLICLILVYLVPLSSSIAKVHFDSIRSPPPALTEIQYRTYQHQKFMLCVDLFQFHMLS